MYEIVNYLTDSTSTGTKKPNNSFQRHSNDHCTMCNGFLTLGGLVQQTNIRVIFNTGLQAIIDDIDHTGCYHTKYILETGVKF